MSLSIPPKKIVISGILGNFLEGYDLVICSYLAIFINSSLLPSSNGSLLGIFFIFMLAQFVRFFGSFAFGVFADKYGRKRILAISIIALSLSTTLVGLIPPYDSIGWWAAVLLLLSRMMQSVSAGGEYIASVSFLVENGPSSKSGLLGSMATLGLNLGSLTAFIVALLITYLIESNLWPSYSWRFAFFISFIGGFVGAWFRYNIPESLDYIVNKNRETKDKQGSLFAEIARTLKKEQRKCVSIVLISWCGVYITYLMLVYTPVHLSLFNHYSHTESLLLTFFLLVSVVFFIPIFGYISDRLGKKNILLFSCSAFMFFSLPYFWLISQSNQFLFICSEIVFGMLAASYFSVAPTLLAKSFPVGNRCTMAAILYAFSASVASGIAPYLSLKVAQQTGNFLSPGILLFCCTAVGLIGTFIYSHDSDHGKKVSSAQLVIVN